MCEDDNKKIKVNTTEQNIFLCAVSNHAVIVKLCKKFEYILCIQDITRQSSRPFHSRNI